MRKKQHYRQGRIVGEVRESGRADKTEVLLQDIAPDAVRMVACDLQS